MSDTAERTDVDYEAVHWIRDATERVTGGNFSFVDDDLRVLTHLAALAVQSGLHSRLHPSVARKIDRRLAFLAQLEWMLVAMASTPKPKGGDGG